MKHVRWVSTTMVVQLQQELLIFSRSECKDGKTIGDGWQEDLRNVKSLNNLLSKWANSKSYQPNHVCLYYILLQ